MSSVFKFEISHIINENIERVWSDVRSYTLFQTLLPNIVSKSVLIKGNDSWTIGSVYETSWLGVSKLTGTCIDVENTTSKKKLSYHINSTIDLNYIKTISLFSITTENATYAIFEISVSDFNQSDQIQILTEEGVQFYKSIYKQYFIKYDQYLIKSLDPVSNYESCLIKCDRKALWDLITDMNQTSNQLTGIPKLTFEYSADRLTIGTVIKGINHQTQKTSFFYVENCIQDNKRDKWIYVVKTLGSLNTVSHQQIEINLIRIKDEMCQVSFLHEFKHRFNKESFINLSKEKQNFLAKLKQIFEVDHYNDNSHSSNCNNNSNNSSFTSSDSQKASIDERVISIKDYNS